MTSHQKRVMIGSHTVRQIRQGCWGSANLRAPVPAVPKHTSIKLRTIDRFILMKIPTGVSFANRWLQTADCESIKRDTQKSIIMSEILEDVQAVPQDGMVADNKDTTRYGDNKFQDAISAWRSELLRGFCRSLIWYIFRYRPHLDDS